MRRNTRRAATWQPWTCLSILYYLAKINMGESENFWRVLVEAERSLATSPWSIWESPRE